MAGRATAALLEVILGEKLTQKRIYGDNVATIAFSSNGLGSWRTPHLRIRAASLRWALEDGGWALTQAAGCRRHDKSVERPGLRALQGRPGHAGGVEVGEKSHFGPE